MNSPYRKQCTEIAPFPSKGLGLNEHPTEALQARTFPRELLGDIRLER